MSVTLVDAPPVSSSEQQQQPVLQPVTAATTNNSTVTTSTVVPSCSQYLRFEVKDTGPGVPDEKKDTLFKPFSQLQKGVGGTGLGLYSVKKKITILGGTVGCENNPDTGDNTGVIFWFTIPYTPDTWGNNPMSATSSAYNSSMSLNRSQVDVMVADEYTHSANAIAVKHEQEQQQQQQQQQQEQQTHSNSNSSSRRPETSRTSGDDARSSRCLSNNVYGVTVDTSTTAATTNDHNTTATTDVTAVSDTDSAVSDIETGRGRVVKCNSSGNSGGTGNHHHQQQQQQQNKTAWLSQQHISLKSQSSLSAVQQQQQRQSATAVASSSIARAASSYDSSTSSNANDDTECYRESRAVTEPIGLCNDQSHSNGRYYSNHQLKVRQLQQQHASSIRSALPYAMMQRGGSASRVVPTTNDNTAAATATTTQQQQQHQQQHGPITLAPLIHVTKQNSSNTGSSSNSGAAAAVADADMSKCVLIVEDEPSISKFLTVSASNLIKFALLMLNNQAL
jgi:Histidine kinase-, DNA gyrase B-, and HSP90-like ATPase